MTKTRISILVITFLSSIFLTTMPNWYYDNFWAKADFWDDWGFRIPYLAFLIIYAALATLFVEAVIRFIKKFA